MKPLSNLARCGALALALLLTSQVAQAGDAPPVAAPTAPEHPAVPHVDVIVVGSFVNAEQVGARVAGWFTGQGIATQTRLMPELSAAAVFAPSETPGVRVWLTQSAPASARLFFAVQPGREAPRFLVQDVELRSGVDELGIERLAQLAYFSAIAAWEGSAESSRQDVERGFGLSAGQAVAPAAAAAKPSATKASATKASATKASATKASATKASAPRKNRSNDGWRGRSLWAFGTSVRGEGGVFIGGEWDAGLFWRRGRNELGLMSRFHWAIVPYEVEKDGITLDVSAISFGAQLGASRRLTEDWWLNAQFGAAAEGVTVRAHSSTTPSIQEAPGSGSPYRPKLFGRLGSWVDLGPLKYLFAATVEVAFARPHYDVADSAVRNSRRALIVPWAVQPGISFGVFF
jgi:hypothetical protein